MTKREHEASRETKITYLFNKSIKMISKGERTKDVRAHMSPCFEKFLNLFANDYDQSKNEIILPRVLSHTYACRTLLT